MRNLCVPTATLPSPILYLLSPAKAVAAALALLLLAPCAAASTPAHLWSHRFGNVAVDEGRAVAVDGSGNVYITGSFTRTVNFGGDDLVSAHSNAVDIFVAKYNAGGGHLWSRRFGEGFVETGTAIAVDGSGNVLVAGGFNGYDVSFGGVPLTNAGSWDGFIAKYSTDGVHQWSRAFGSTAEDVAEAVAVDASGNVLVAGHFRGTVSFGGPNLVSAGLDDIFVAKYDADGTYQWSHSFGGAQNDEAYGVATDPSGNVLVTGYFRTTVAFGGDPLTSAGSQDIFMAKYNPEGVHQWSQRLGGASGNDIGYALAVDNAGAVVLTGTFNGTVNFGGADLNCNTNSDIFVAKYDGAGSHQWSHCFGAADLDDGRSVAVDGWGNVFVTGNFSGTADFGGGDLVSAGPDIFVAQYDASGVHQWSQNFGGYLSDTGLAVAADGSGGMLVTGLFQLTANLGGSDLVSAGGSDIFVARFGDATTGVGDAAQASALSLSTYGNPFNPSGTVRYTVPESGRVTIGLYDMRGSVVATLADEVKAAGAYEIAWNGTDAAGRRVGSGMYFVRLTFGGETRTRKLVFLK